MANPILKALPKIRFEGIELLANLHFFLEPAKCFAAFIILLHKNGIGLYQIIKSPKKYRVKGIELQGIRKTGLYTHLSNTQHCWLYTDCMHH
jgi:hypothetical protein